MPDEELPQVVEDEAVPPEADEAVPPEPTEPEPDLTDLDEAIEALGEDDPVVKALREKLAPPPMPLDEERLLWETEKDRQERLNRVSAARQYAAAYEPDSLYQAATSELYARTALWQQQLEATAKAIHDGDYDPDNGVFDASAAAQEMAVVAAQLAEQAIPAATSWATSRMEDTLLTALEQSAVHRHLTREDRQALKEAQKMQYADWRAARYAAIYLNAAVRNAPEVRERMTKAERDAEREREQHRETVLAAIGRGGAVTNGSVSPSREAQILMDPRTPVSELIKIRARQQAG